MTDQILGIMIQFGEMVLAGLPTTLALAVVLTILCVLFPAAPGKHWWRKSEIITDVCWWFATPLINRYLALMLIILGSFGLSMIFGGSALGPDGSPGLQLLTGMPFWLSALVYISLIDVMMYATHRAFHTMSLWRYHAVHHSSEELHWVSARRFHPVDDLIHIAFPDVVLLLLGMPMEVIAFVAPFQIWHSALIHSNLNWDFGILKTVIVSPIYHRWHHTGIDQGGSKNFAATFPILDLMFGTYYMPKGERPERFGIDDPTFPKDFGGQIMRPFRQSA